MSSLRRIKNGILLLAAVAGSLGCSAMEQEKRQLYLQSESIAPLQLPAGFETPRNNVTLPLPQVTQPPQPFDAAPPVNLAPELLAEEPPAVPVEPAKNNRIDDYQD